MSITYTYDASDFKEAFNFIVQHFFSKKLHSGRTRSELRGFGALTDDLSNALFLDFIIYYI